MACPLQLVKKVPLGFFDKLLSELQNRILQYYFAILPLTVSFHTFLPSETCG